MEVSRRRSDTDVAATAAAVDDARWRVRARTFVEVVQSGSCRR